MPVFHLRWPVKPSGPRDRTGPDYTGEDAAETSAGHPVALWSTELMDKRIIRILAGAFLLVLLLAVVAGAAGIRSLYSIQRSASDLVAELRIASDLVVQVQAQMGNLHAVTLRLAKDPAAIDTEHVLSSIRQAESRIASIAGSRSGMAEEERWRELEAASKRFSEEVQASLSLQNPPAVASEDLVARYQELTSVASGLINLSYQRAIGAQGEIDRLSRRLLNETLFAVGLTVSAGLVFAILVLRLTARLLTQMDSQANELSRVTWQMLENQEETARRFSHELHDELGQSLTAIKANLAAHIQVHPSERQQWRDCLGLVDEAIENVREMSRLLHPRVLDDFGLVAALQSMVERLAQHTGLEIQFDTNVDRRLPLDTATSLYRIAQEALTNVVRHANASAATVRLWREDGRVSLSISDNGVGLPEFGPATRDGLGLAGIAARARHSGGAFEIGQAEDGGARIRVDVPVKGYYDDGNDPNIARG